MIVCLLLLAVSPVTAPFSTFDLGDLTPVAPFDDTTVKPKGADHPQINVATVLTASGEVPGQEPVAGRARAANPRYPSRVLVPLRI